ncbi:MAG: MmgE/PrpD family protein [Anaerolineae bacterium]|nr:MmgE/PrpD family protein [Anaerolineae bacterium]
MDGTALVAQFIAGTRWELLPPAVQRKARLTLLDALGAALAGLQAPVARITAEFAEETWPGEQATILCSGRRASAAGAAFANGYAANAIDIDDCALYTKGHPGAQIFPTALALSEALGRSGAEMLAGMVVGYEVAHRAARIWHATHREYQACGSWGSVACAAVASHLMGLPPAQIQHALGIAEYHAPNLPMMRDIDHPAMVKHGIGWGAMNGILSAQLAARGFTGIPSLFSLETYADWVSDIGRHFIMVDGVIFKTYCACAWGHASFDAARRLVDEHHIRIEDISHIRIETFHNAVRLGANLPATTEEAQFNVAWPLACLLVDGEIGPAQVLEKRLQDERLRELASKVELVESPEYTALYEKMARGEAGGKYLSSVTITLRDGRTFRSGPVEGNIAYPQPWDEEKAERKFRWLAGRLLPADFIEQVLEAVRQFEALPDVRPFAAALCEHLPRTTG